MSPARRRGINCLADPRGRLRGPFPVVLGSTLIVLLTGRSKLDSSAMLGTTPTPEEAGGTPEELSG